MHQLKEANWPTRQGELFKERHSSMMHIRAELSAFELGDIAPGHDEKHNEITERLQTATALVMTTHAPHDCMVWQKIQIFEDALHGTGDCEWTDHHQVWMFACIKADLMAHGIGG